MVSDLRSCTMLSTLPLFYIAQSVNSDDRRTRIQGLRVIMQRPVRRLKACLHGGGGPQVGELTRLGAVKN